MNEEIKEIMNNIDDRMSKLAIFNRQSKEDILLRSLFVCRDMINKIPNNISYAKEVLVEIDTIDKIAQLAYKYARGNEKNENISIENLYRKVQKYVEICNIYEMGREGNYKYTIDKKIIRVKYESDQVNIDNETEVQNIIQNLKKSKMREKILEEKINSVNYDIFDAAKEIVNSTREVGMDNNLVIDGFTLGNFWEIEAFLLVACLRDYASYNKYSVLEIGEEELIDSIHKKTGLKKNIAIAVVKFLTFNYDDKLSLMCTPLVKNGKFIYIGTFLIINANYERNLITILNIKYSSIINKNQHQKEKIFLDKIQNIVKKYSNLFFVRNKDLKDEKGNKITDVDFAIYDKKNALIIEAKNFIQPDSISEHLNYIGRKDDKGLRKGYNQIKKQKNLLNMDREWYLQKVFGKTAINEISFLLMVNGYIGNIRDPQIDIMNIAMFDQMMSECQGNLSLVFEFISHKKYINKLNYEIGVKEIKLFGYTFYVPVYLVADDELT